MWPYLPHLLIKILFSCSTISYRYCNSFCSCVIFHCMDIPHSVYLGIEACFSCSSSLAIVPLSSCLSGDKPPVKYCLTVAHFQCEHSVAVLNEWYMMKHTISLLKEILLLRGQLPLKSLEFSRYWSCAKTKRFIYKICFFEGLQEGSVGKVPIA